jgi:Membrane protein putatively involved in post-translational modification of the autoinducing quorum-sensing peptide
MEWLAKKLANNIAVSLNYDAEKESVVAYGLIAMIQTFCTVLLVLIFGLIIGAPIEALIVCFSVSILRKYSGGAHVGTIEECTAIAVIYSVGCAAVSKFLLASHMNLYINIALILVVFLISYITIHILAPVDSPRKPIKTETKRKRMKKGSYIVITVYLVIETALVILQYRYTFVNSFILSLMFGLAWQIFTLTRVAAHFLQLIDNSLNYIFKKRKEADCV